MLLFRVCSMLSNVYLDTGPPGADPSNLVELFDSHESRNNDVPSCSDLTAYSEDRFTAMSTSIVRKKNFLSEEKNFCEPAIKFDRNRNKSEKIMWKPRAPKELYLKNQASTKTILLYLFVSLNGKLGYRNFTVYQTTLCIYSSKLKFGKKFVRKILLIKKSGIYSP